MSANRTSIIREILAKSGKDIVEDWLKEQLASITMRKDLLPEADIRSESAEFMSLFAPAVAGGNLKDITVARWR